MVSPENDPQKQAFVYSNKVRANKCSIQQYQRHLKIWTLTLHPYIEDLNQNKSTITDRSQPSNKVDMSICTEIKGPSAAITVLMANLSTILSDLLRNAFEDVPDIHIVNTNNDVQDLLDASKRDTADVIVLGSARVENVCSAVAILDVLPERHKNAQVIVLTQKPGYGEVISLFRAGAKGIICTSTLRFEMLCKSIRCVHAGQIWASNEQLAYLVSSVSRPRSTDVTDVNGKLLLTVREQQVLHLLADGLSNFELAAVLRLSEHTVKNHLFHIYDKLGVSNRMEAVLYALTPRIALPVPARIAPASPFSKVRMMRAG